MIHRKPKLDFQQVLKLIFICLVAQSCLTLCALMDCSSPGKNTGVGCHALLQGIFLTQGSNPHLLHWQVDSLPLSHLESPKLLFPIFNLDLRSSQAKSERLFNRGGERGHCSPAIIHSSIHSLAFSMIQWMLALWSLISQPFLNPACTSGSSWFTYCWSLA